MSCERYTAALTDAACGAPMTADLAAHLDACGACRAAFDEQQRLLAWVDGTLRETLDISASGDLPARVIATVAARRRRTFGIGWWQVAAAAAAIALAVYAWPAARHDRREPEPPSVRVPPHVVQSQAPAPTAPVVQPQATRRQRVRVPARSAAAQPTMASRPPHVDVLIPESQTRAIARLQQLTRHGGVDPDAPPPAAIAAELQIAPLVIPRLVVGDLQSGGGSL